jgi:ABC transport system ATP-binding/permease protein
MSSNILSINRLSKSYGVRQLFSDITFGIERGEKVALVAKNGSGKTSLMKIMVGLDSPDSGEVVFNNNIRVSYLSQEHDFGADMTIMEVLLHSEHPAILAYKNYQHLLQYGADDEALRVALDEMEKCNAWDVEAKVNQMLAVFQMKDANKKISQLSGGQIKRVALAKILLEEPDLLLLDEPTNHLDLDMIEWLEGFLKSMSSAIFMVTHDRYFLNRVCGTIYELDNQKLYKYKGDYSYFMEKKAGREEQLASEVAKAKKLIS